MKITLETVMAFLKSRPPDILNPQGDGPIRFTVNGIMWRQAAIQCSQECCGMIKKVVWEEAKKGGKKTTDAET